MKKRTINRKGVWVRLGGNQGSSLIGALFAVTLFAYGGMSLLQLTASENTTSVNEMQTAQALQVGTGGLEQAKYLLDLGLSPDVENKPLGFGGYTVTTDPSNGLVTVESQVGQGRKIQSIDADFSKDCVDLDVSQAYTDNYNLEGVQLVKSCNAGATISTIFIDWNWSDCVLNSENPLVECPNDHDDDHDHGSAVVQHISIEGTQIYNPGEGIGQPGGGGADPYEEIDVVDYGLSGDGEYTFEGPPHPIRFSEKHPGTGLYFITVQFADGSQITETFHDQTGGSSVAEQLGVETDHGALKVDPDREVQVEVLCASSSATVQWGTVANDGSVSYTDFFNGNDINEGDASVASSGEGGTYSIRVDSPLLDIDSTDSLQSKSLANGETLPVDDAKDCLDSLIDNDGAVSILPNEILILYELDVTLPWNNSEVAADLQDVVLLVRVLPDASAESNFGEEEFDECGDGKYIICHVPSGDFSKAKTLCIDDNGWENGHDDGAGIHSEDYLGSCTDEDEEEDDDKDKEKKDK